jgi:hypothetical protein
LIPTAEEIRSAYDVIRLQGPTGNDIRALSLLAVDDPTLKEIIGDMVLDIAAMLRPLNNQERAMFVGLVDGAVTAGLRLGLEIGEARRAARAPAQQKIEVFAWIGKDRQDGALKLERGGTAAATYPLVAMDPYKMDRFASDMEGKARLTSLKRLLARFTFAEVVRKTEHGT